MSFRNIRARIAAEHPDMTSIQSVTVFGHELTRDYAEITVSDEVFAKLKGNSTIDVLVKKGSAAPVAEPEPEPEQV